MAEFERILCDCPSHSFLMEKCVNQQHKGTFRIKCKGCGELRLITDGFLVKEPKKER